MNESIESNQATIKTLEGGRPALVLLHVLSGSPNVPLKIRVNICLLEIETNVREWSAIVSRAFVISKRMMSQNQLCRASRCCCCYCLIFIDSLGIQLFIMISSRRMALVIVAIVVEFTEAFAPSSTLSLEQGAKVFYDHGLIASKQRVLDLLRSGEMDNSPKLTPHLEELYDAYKLSGADARCSVKHNGDFENVNLPQFPGGRGHNEQGQPLYTLGRLTFNQIPNGKNVMVASEKMVQRVHPHHGELPKDLPPVLKDSIINEPSKLRTFSIDTYFTVVEEAHNDLKGVMRAEGFMYPHETQPNHFHSFFAGGKCFSRTNTDDKEWNEIFGGDIGLKDTNDEMGMVEDTSLAYSLNTPFTSQSTILYLDDDLRITVGQEGSRMINVRELSSKRKKVFDNDTTILRC